ncbi:transient receptor potential cation channel subfamily V member 1-like [Pelodytes ibericus]
MSYNSPPNGFHLEAHDEDTRDAFDLNRDGEKDEKPPMDSEIQKENGPFGDEIGFNMNFLPKSKTQNQGNQNNSPKIKPEDVYTRERIFKAVSNHDVNDLSGLKEYLRITTKLLSNQEYIDHDTGKTCLLKAMWSLKEGKNETIPVLLDATKRPDSKEDPAENIKHLKQLVNAPYTNAYYKGQTALHIAIVKGNLELVKLLMENGADVHAKADGFFFQKKKKKTKEPSFYFGELPLSLAACTTQPEIVDYLLNNEHRKANIAERDGLGNTVLHALVMVADDKDDKDDNDTKEGNTEKIVKMYDDILKRSVNINPKLEEIKNRDGFTPLQLAAMTGKVKLFQHLLQREITEQDCKHLSRKFTDWTYGPLQASLYDISSVDTHESDSVMETIVFKSNANNRQDMIVLEPINQLLQDKWDTFAWKIFFTKFLLYCLYLIIFTVTVYNRPLVGQPPFPLEGGLKESFRVIGETIIMLGGVYILLYQITYFCKRRPSARNILMDGYFEILFLLQAVVLLCGGIVYLAGSEVYITLLVFALVVGWVNMLYYTRGFQLTGIYSVMIQKAILRDLFRFVLVYFLFLFGFAAALVTLSGEVPQEAGNNTDVEKSEGVSYGGFYVTILELFKFTIGMGDLEFNENLKFKHFIMFLLVLYVVLTYVLLLNMLIALMSETINRTSVKSKNIWKLQRAATILDIEKFLPSSLRNRWTSGRWLDVGKTPDGNPDRRWCYRVEEMLWDSWNKDTFSLQSEPIEKERIEKDELSNKKTKGIKDQGNATEEEKTPLQSASSSPSDIEKGF